VLLSFAIDLATSIVQVMWRRADRRERTGLGLLFGSSEAPLLIAESFGQTLTSMTVSAMSTADLGEDDLATIHILKITMAKILGKRRGPSGVEYRCEFEPL
jgi:hypothetical protein